MPAQQGEELEGYLDCDPKRYPVLNLHKLTDNYFLYTFNAKKGKGKTTIIQEYHCWTCHKILKDAEIGAGYCRDCAYVWENKFWETRFGKNGIWQCRGCKQWSLTRWMSRLSMQKLS